VTEGGGYQFCDQRIQQCDPNHAAMGYGQVRYRAHEPATRTSPAEQACRIATLSIRDSTLIYSKSGGVERFGCVIDLAEPRKRTRLTPSTPFSSLFGSDL
jgi:hypothetical protein